MRFRARLDDLRKGVLATDPVRPYLKNYDEFVEERPTSLARRFDMSDWAIFAAFVDGLRVGGAILAPPGAIFDAATLVDVRVAPDARCIGVGRALFARVKDWAIEQGYKEIKVETQDVNVQGCLFYAASGFQIESIDEHAYPKELNETKLIWSLKL